MKNQLKTLGVLDIKVPCEARWFRTLISGCFSVGWFSSTGDVRAINKRNIQQTVYRRFSAPLHGMAKTHNRKRLVSTERSFAKAPLLCHDLTTNLRYAGSYIATQVVFHGVTASDSPLYGVAGACDKQNNIAIKRYTGLPLRHLTV